MNVNIFLPEELELIEPNESEKKILDKYKNSKQYSNAKDFYPTKKKSNGDFVVFIVGYEDLEIL